MLPFLRIHQTRASPVAGTGGSRAVSSPRLLSPGVYPYSHTGLTCLFSAWMSSVRWFSKSFACFFFLFLTRVACFSYHCILRVRYRFRI